MNESHLLLTQTALGRILLHIGCALHRPSNWHWYWRGIQRELPYLLVANAWNAALSFCRQQAVQALIAVILFAGLSSTARGRSENTPLRTNRIASRPTACAIGSH